MQKQATILFFLAILCAVFFTIPLLSAGFLHAQALSPDINNNGTVDIQDLGILLSNWNQTGANQADLNNNGTVDIQDLGILLSAWGTSGVSTPTPTATPTQTIPIGPDEPFFDVARHDLIYMHDPADYRGKTISELADPSDPSFDNSFVGFRPAPAPWGPSGPYDPSGFELIPGRTSESIAFRLSRSGISQQQSYTWWSDNMPAPNDAAHHYFQHWARVTMASPLEGPLNVKWFMARHDGGGSRFQWNTFWAMGVQHDNPPPPGTTVWMGAEDGSLAAQQAVGPYFSDIATVDGSWHRFTYEYKPNSANGARDGIARMWVDGIKIIDISASAMGITPLGGTKPWCTGADIDAINVLDPVVSVSWPSVQTTNSPPWTMDVDELIWWTERD